MRAILIAPDLQTITQVDFLGTLDHAYQLLGIDRGSRLVQAVPIRLAGNDQLLVDEEGLLRDETRALGAFSLSIVTLQSGFFKVPVLGTPLHGRGLVVGETNGDWAHCKSDVHGIAQQVAFHQPIPRVIRKG